MAHSFWSWHSASLKNVKTLTGLALFCALYVALAFFTIHITPTLFVSFSFLALAASCSLYGLWPNLIFAFAADLLGYLVNPAGTYMPLFALVLMVKAAIYSFFFYGRKKISWTQVIPAQLLVVLLCNLLLNPIILSMMYQTPFWALLLSRLLKNAILLPIECLALMALFSLIRKTGRFSSVS